MANTSDIPIYKVGLIALRHVGGTPEVMLVKPIPKQQGSNTTNGVPWVLPRGSRCYKEHDIWQDVRNNADAIKHKNTLEPITDTLLREAKEEAGVPPELLHKGPLYDFAVHEHISSSPGSPRMRIQFYVMPMTEDQVKKLNPNPPDASAPPQWFTLDKMKELAAAGESRAGYVKIIEGALQALAAKNMPQVTIPAPQRTR